MIPNPCSYSTDPRHILYASLPSEQSQICLWDRGSSPYITICLSGRQQDTVPDVVYDSLKQQGPSDGD